MPREQTGQRRFRKKYSLWMIFFVGLAAFGVFRLNAHKQLKQRIETLGHLMDLVEEVNKEPVGVS